MRLIDADALLNYAGNCYDEDGHLLYAVGTGTIMRMPTIDAVQVVRCRDCKYIGPLSPTDDYNTCKHKRAMVYAPADGFCGWGERRTDETIRE